MWRLGAPSIGLEAETNYPGDGWFLFRMGERLDSAVCFRFSYP